MLNTHYLARHTLGVRSMAVSVERLLWASYGFTFAQNLKRIRRIRGITQQVLAEISGLSRTQVCNLERNENNSGTSADPALSTVYKLALALEVPPSLLLPESGENVSSICTTTGTRTALMHIQSAKVGDGDGENESHLAAHLEGLEPFSREYTDYKRGEVKAKKPKTIKRAIHKTA